MALLPISFRPQDVIQVLLTFSLTEANAKDLAVSFACPICISSASAATSPTSLAYTLRLRLAAKDYLIC